MGKKDWESYFSALKKQDWESAKDCLLQLLKEEKKNPQLHLKIGDVYQRTGDSVNAVSSYLIAGRLLDAQGFSQKALAAFKIILRIEPDNREVISRAQTIMDNIENTKRGLQKPVGIPGSPDSEQGHAFPAREPTEPLAPLSGTDRHGRNEQEPYAPPSPLGRTEGSFPDSAWLESTSLSETQSGQRPVEVPPEPLSVGKELPEDNLPLSSADGVGGSEEEWLKSAYDAIDRSVTKERPESRVGEETHLRPEEDNASRVLPEETEIETGLLGSPDDLSGSVPHEMRDLIQPLSDRPGIPSKPAVFSDLPDDVYREFVSELDSRTFSHGQRIIEEGDSGDSMYLIRSGKARVVAHLLGREIELALLEEGDLFGEVGFLTGRPRTASVTAEGSLGVFEISRMNIEKIIEVSPEVLAKLEEFYEGRVIDTIRKIRP